YGLSQRGRHVSNDNYATSSTGSTLATPVALLRMFGAAHDQDNGHLAPRRPCQISAREQGHTAGAVLNGGSLSRVAGENVGVYGLNQGGLGLVSRNYPLNYQGNNLTITKALLNVLADAKTKVYGDADPSLTYQVSGLRNGD
ncbi:hypothetical protein LH483_28705, partial [Klebsiella pneumoniae]|nr:hypothetical protein [Klebsiella pneumoniae]